MLAAQKHNELSPNWVNFLASLLTFDYVRLRKACTSTVGSIVWFILCASGHI